MPDAKFDLGDYVEVKDRLALLYELFPKARITTAHSLTREPDDKPKVIVEAAVYRDEADPVPAGVGRSWMYLPGSTPYTKGSEIENAETSAVGRAIGMLGILIMKSIATTNEIESKAREPEPEMTADDGSLIGTAQVGKPPSDYELRQTPQGFMLSFRLADGRRSIKVVAYDTLAEALALVKEDVIGARVQCWGVVSDEQFTPKGTTKPITYQVLTLHRIQTPTVILPAPEAPSLPLFDLDPEIAAAADAA